jgi:hypothetical protein
MALTLFAPAMQATPAAHADEIAFSADALETHPNGAKRYGRLHVLGSASSYEYKRMGISIIEIELPASGIRRVLFPASRTYFETPLVGFTSNDASPCPSETEVDCRRTGKEVIGASTTEIWTITRSDTSGATRLWWDTSRNMAVRIEHPDGSRLQTVMRESDDYEGMHAEQWELTHLLPGGRYIGGMMIIATELRMPVVERRPDGLIRHLVNIARGGVSADVFHVPAGYRRISAPSAPVRAEPPAAADASQQRQSHHYQTTSGGPQWPSHSMPQMPAGPIPPPWAYVNPMPAPSTSPMPRAPLNP